MYKISIKIKEIINLFFDRVVLITKKKMLTAVLFLA